AATNDYGDVEVVEPDQAEQVISVFLGSPAPLPIATPPLDTSGYPQEITDSTGGPPASTTSLVPNSGNAGTAPSPTTTVPEQSPTQFDPTVC
ncbi:MAG TPA: hypothetical protein VG346_04290, partial [Acidimicrobiales bacterium]|nr:hypothetical protein [Acidimicrobiales bacterium]